MAKLTKAQVAEIVRNAPMGTTPEGVVAALRAQGHALEGYPDAGQPSVIGSDPLGVAPALRRGLAILPGVGGFVGGLPFGVAGPQASLGSGAGAMVGEGLRQAGDAALGAPPVKPMERASRIATEGGKEAAYAFVGGRVAKHAPKVAAGVMRFALKQTKTSFSNFGDLASAVIARGMEVGQKGKEAATAGAEAAQKAARAAWIGAVEDVQALLASADAAGTQINVAQLAKPLIKGAERVANGPLGAEQRSAIIKMVRESANEVLNRRGYGTRETRRTTFRPTEVKIIKQGWQADVGSGGYAAKQQGKMVQASPDATMDMATGAREALEGSIPDMAAAEGRVSNLINLRKMIRTGRRPASPWQAPEGMQMDPALAPLFARSRGAVGLERVMTDATGRQPPTMIPLLMGTIAGAGPGGMGGGPAEALLAFLASRYALSPLAMSRAAKWIATPAAGDILRQGPRGIDMLSDQLMFNSGEMPDSLRNR